MRPVLLVKNNMSNYRVKLISPKKTSERNQLARHDSFLNDSQLAFKAHIQWAHQSSAAASAIMIASVRVGQYNDSQVDLDRPLRDQVKDESMTTSNLRTRFISRTPFKGNFLFGGAKTSGSSLGCKRSRHLRGMRPGTCSSIPSARGDKSLKSRHLRQVKSWTSIRASCHGIDMKALEKVFWVYGGYSLAESLAVKWSLHWQLWKNHDWGTSIDKSPQAFCSLSGQLVSQVSYNSCSWCPRGWWCRCRCWWLF